jgi:signal transduction histidine kinase/CheY-like chemotaxis protein
MIKRAGGRAEILLRYSSSTDYELWGCNEAAASLFQIDASQLQHAPLKWAQIPPVLVTWLVEAFNHFKGEPEAKMPNYVAGGNAPVVYLSKLFYESATMQAGENRWDEFWYLYCFQKAEAPIAVAPANPPDQATSAVTWIDGEQKAVNQQKLETIGELASGVAHDFNNLIMGIQSNAEALLPQQHLTERDRDTIINIIRACSTGSSLTRSLLGYAKKQPLSLVRFNLVDMISDVARIAGLTSKINTQVVLCDEFLSKENPIEVVACYSSLSHCLLNLIKNAREAMPKGGTVTVLWQGNETTANITVKDEGGGMSPETLQHIFEPFFSTKKQGTGLGLAMVRGIMSQHSGTVEIRSEVGLGTVVSLVWPRFGKETDSPSSVPLQEPRKSTQQLLRQTAISPAPKFAVGALAPRKPLAYVVDDDDLVRDGLVSLMQHLGHEVKAFSKPQEALHDLVTTPVAPKVLITDYNMPVMTGEQLIAEYCQFAQNNPSHLHVRILLMSGLPPGHFQDFIARYKNMNVGTLEKPFSMETLRNKVQNVQSLRKMTTMLGVIKPSKEMKHFVPRSIGPPPTSSQ